MAFDSRVIGLENLESVRHLGPVNRAAASAALNDTARRQRTASARIIARELNLRTAQLAPGRKVLYVSRLSNPRTLEARITATGRATSLAEFVRGAARGGRDPIVSVKPGTVKTIRGAFLNRAKTRLLIRVRKGSRIRGRRTRQNVRAGQAVPLFGPSVQQAFIGERGTGVAKDIERKTANLLVERYLGILRARGLTR